MTTRKEVPILPLVLDLEEAGYEAAGSYFSHNLESEDVKWRRAEPKDRE